MTKKTDDTETTGNERSPADEIDNAVLKFVTEKGHVTQIDVLQVALPDSVTVAPTGALLGAIGESIDRLVEQGKLVRKDYGGKRGLALPGV